MMNIIADVAAVAVRVFLEEKNNLTLITSGIKDRLAPGCVD